MDEEAKLKSIVNDFRSSEFVSVLASLSFEDVSSPPHADKSNKMKDRNKIECKRLMPI